MTTLQTSLLDELEPVVAEPRPPPRDGQGMAPARLRAVEHEGRDFAFLGGEDWAPEDSPLDPVAKAAMIVNLLTEDNLPSATTARSPPGSAATAPGARGSAAGRPRRAGTAIALRDYLVVTRGVDPVELERARMDHMTAGLRLRRQDRCCEALAYVSFQELATRVSHRNTGRPPADPIADQLLARIATDENLHMVFYRNLMAAALDIDAGRDDAGDPRRGRRLRDARRGMAGLPQELDDHRQGRHLRPAAAPRRGDQPVLRFWQVFERTDFGPAGEQAREELAPSSRLDAKAKHYEEKRAAREELRRTA